MTIFRHFINQGVTNHSKIKTLSYFRLRSSAVARNSTHNNKNGSKKIKKSKPSFQKLRQS